MDNQYKIELSPYDDKNTILYQYVYQYKLPKSFFTFKRGQVYNIYNSKYDFNALDSLMVYYENLVKIDLNYKQWIIDGHRKKIKPDLTEYDVEEILNWYNETYKPDSNINNYFKNYKTIYYQGDITELFKIYNRKKDIKIFDLILTQQDYDFSTYELEITPDQDLLSELNQYKQKFKSLRNIRYDSNSFMNEYTQWVIDTNKSYMNDLKIATTIHDIQSLLKPSKLSISPKTYDFLTKIYNPYFIDRNAEIDIYDGIDLFNDAVLSPISPYLIYKDVTKQYYKIYDDYYINPKIYENTNVNFIYYPLILNKTYDVIYNLNDNTLQISYTHYKNTPQENIIFPSLTLGDIVDYNMEGHFNIWDIELDEKEFLNFITNNNLINQILFVNERKFTYKKSISLKYIPLNSNTVINIDLTQLFYIDDRVVDDLYGKLKLTKKKREYIPYIQVKFKNIYDEASFTNFITSLISQYKATSKSALAFNLLLFNIEDKKERDIDENLRKLKNIAPDVFVEGYANFCDVKKRPKPIDKEEIEDYINNKIKEFGFKGEKAKEFRKNAVLKFPINNEEIYLVCDHADDPYPYLKATMKSKKLTTLNKEEYEELPCCKKIVPKTVKTTKKEPTHITSTSIIFNVGSTGELPADLKYLLQNYNINKNNFLRLGVVSINPYSFIHCLCYATDDTGYINTKNKNEYVLTVLEKLKNMNMALVKQELYDVDDINLNVDFFDPDLYYRLLEEYFTVNIYVFNKTLIVPRYKSFHTRPYRERPTVLIYKNENQCELIYNQLTETNRVLIFNDDMGKYCHNILKNVLHTYTFVNNNKINVFDNLYYHANHLEFIPNIVSQYIDEEGKTRAFHIKVKNQLMTIMTLPCQPENLPIDLNIYRVNIDTVLNIMSQNYTAITKSDLATGLWYQIYDVEYGEYIPIIPTNIDGKIGPNCELDEYKSTKTSNYYDTKKTLNKLLQIIQWLFLVVLYKYNIDTVDEFFDQFISIGKQTYEINMPRRLPVYDHIDDYFDYVSKYTSLLRNNQIIIDEDLHDKLKLYLYQFNLNDNDIPIFIRNYYMYVEDFNKQPNTSIFLNDETFKAWQENYKNIYYEILPYTIYPYIYKTNYGKMFLIQNVDYDLDKALAVCDFWDKHQINIGYKGDIYDANLNNVNIYKVNDLNQLELVQLGKYHVLDYNYRPEKIGKYAAMLPL